MPPQLFRYLISPVTPSKEDDYFINTTISSRQLLFQYYHQQQIRQCHHLQQIAISLIPPSAEDNYFISTSISSRQLLLQYHHQQQIATSSMPPSAVDSYFINTTISSRQLRYLSSSYSYFTYIKSRQLLHQCQNEEQIAILSVLSSKEELLYQYHQKQIATLTMPPPAVLQLLN